MKKQIDILELANAIIGYQNLNGNTISQLKLQKLLYYIQSWNFVFNDFNLFINNELPEAWVNGPVYRKVFDNFKNSPLYDDLTIVNNFELDQAEQFIDKLKLDKKVEEVVYSVLQKYGSFSSDYLALLTHNEEPWLEARKDTHILSASNKAIDSNLMKTFYSKMFEYNTQKYAQK